MTIDNAIFMPFYIVTSCVGLDMIDAKMRHVSFLAACVHEMAGKKRYS